MAVKNAYTDSLAAAGKKASPGNMAPGQVFALAMTFEVAVADDILSVYRIANLNSNLIPLWLKIACDAAIDITDLDVGLYLPASDGGAVVDLDCFADGINPNAGYIFGSDLEGLISLPIEECGKKLWEIASVVTAKAYTAASHPQAFDLALTAKSEPGAAGTFSVRGMFIQG